MHAHTKMPKLYSESGTQNVSSVREENWREISFKFDDLRGTLNGWGWSKDRQVGVPTNLRGDRQGI